MVTYGDIIKWFLNNVVGIIIAIVLIVIAVQLSGIAQNVITIMQDTYVVSDTGVGAGGSIQSHVEDIDNVLNKNFRVINYIVPIFSLKRDDRLLCQAEEISRYWARV